MEEALCEECGGKAKQGATHCKPCEKRLNANCIRCKAELKKIMSLCYECWGLWNDRKLKAWRAFLGKS